MENKLNYVEDIQENRLFVHCEDKQKKLLLKKIRAKKKFFHRSKWVLEYSSKDDLVKILQALGDNKFMFAGGVSGWNPSDIYRLYREKNLLHGDIIEIFWRGRNKIETWII